MRVILAAEPMTLFEVETEIETKTSDEAAAKSLIDKLLKVRRSLTPDEERFGQPRINLLIEEFRSLVRMTPTQREETVLYSIERQGATTETEIAEDTRLHRAIVKQLVESLIDKGILYKVSRTVIGSDRPQFAIKSRRVQSPEADLAYQRPDGE